MNKPIKRHEALKPLSREHHHGLLLCWKIRQGFKLDIEPERIKAYADWFKVHYLLPHFEAEENYIFPILRKDHPNVKRALAEHQRLLHLFDQEEDFEKNLALIAEELDMHIKFEERVLFNEIQQIASKEEFGRIQEQHHETAFSDDAWKDHFWIK